MAQRTSNLTLIETTGDTAANASFEMKHYNGATFQVVATSFGTIGAQTAVTGTVEVDTLTFPAFAAATDGDYISITDTNGEEWAIALDTTGLGATIPSGAIWAAIDSANKALVDISGATTAAEVAALCEIGLNALVGFSAAVTTDDTAADGTMTLTHAARAVVANPVPKNEDDSGAGSISVAETIPGVASKVDIVNDTIDLGAHAYATGVKGQFTIGGGTLPSGLSLLTDYWVIRVDADKIKVATSLANAQAGTAVALVDEGSATQTITFTPTTGADVTFNLYNSLDNENWVLKATQALSDATGYLYDYPETAVKFWKVETVAGVNKVNTVKVLASACLN